MNIYTVRCQRERRTGRIFQRNRRGEISKLNVASPGQFPGVRRERRVAKRWLHLGSCPRSKPYKQKLDLRDRAKSSPELRRGKVTRAGNRKETRAAGVQTNMKSWFFRREYSVGRACVLFFQRRQKDVRTGASREKFLGSVRDVTRRANIFKTKCRSKNKRIAEPSPSRRVPSIGSIIFLFRLRLSSMKSLFFSLRISAIRALISSRFRAFLPFLLRFRSVFTGRLFIRGISLDIENRWQFRYTPRARETRTGVIYNREIAFSHEFLSIFAACKPSSELHHPGGWSYSKNHTHYKTSRLNICPETVGPAGPQGTGMKLRYQLQPYTANPSNSTNALMRIRAHLPLPRSTSPRHRLITLIVR